MAAPEAFHQQVLSHLLALILNHVDAVGGAGNQQVHLGSLRLLKARIGHELAVQHADAHRADELREGDVRQLQRRAGADDAEDVRLGGEVAGERGRHNLDLVAVGVGKDRTQRAVNPPPGQDSVLAGTALPLEKAAGELARGVHALFKIHHQREEVNALPRLLGAGGGHQQGSAVAANQHGSAGLFGNLAGFQANLIAVNLKFMDDRLHLASQKLVASYFRRPSRWITER